jgi:phosphate starvation-inducible PhoH-like protein
MEKVIKILDHAEARSLFGRHDKNIKLIEEEYAVKIALHDEGVVLKGAKRATEKATNLLNRMLAEIRSGASVSRSDINLGIKAMSNIPNYDLDSSEVILSTKGKRIGPKTKGQDAYVEAIKDNDIVFAIGPAGTGKTYLAMLMAVTALKKGEVRRIILTRPVRETGESLGYLPGDIYQKILPYLRPMYDALYDMMDPERIEKYLEMGVIEVAPLAYMRGRTLNEAFVILDEAQNATSEQLKMFLTRLGFDSKTVITGDVTQSDLPGGKPTGLLTAQKILKEIEGIEFVYFTGSDVVRHELVQKIVKAYEENSE